MGSANLGQVSLFMSCLGFCNIVCNWIPPLILLLTDKEHVEVAYIPWGPVLGAALLSLLIDVLFRHVPATASFIGGTSLIIFSFVLIILPYELMCRGRAQTTPEKYGNPIIRMQELPDHIQEVFRSHISHGSVRQNQK
ncbi:unnamed protein product [Cylicostephanus goldi]|uniref:Uncharacterized protein n=1 Tax=Cylicostephanus goldi TaxID=71465 RepID=A0A3P7N276_CYLGO|nr:unnamed protein product [Cylicostephanus goldi]